MPLILDGRAILAHIKEDLKHLHHATGCTPHLCVFLVGNNPASEIYVASKERHAKEVGIHFTLKRFPETVSQEDLNQALLQANADPEVHAILLQLPLPAGLNPTPLLNLIHPNKDVDGLSDSNLGALMQQNPTTLKPCTPQGVLHLIKLWKKDLTGLNALVIGQSTLVGKPVTQLLLAEGCTVTQAHSKTKNLAMHAQAADLIVSATGCPHLITADHVKPGACVIDVGITKVGEKICGDVDFDSVHKKCSAITPVPGGVGPTTLAYLLKNCFLAAQKQEN